LPGKREPEEARREQIVSAAYAVASRAGIAGVTLRAVAAEAGLSHGLVLFHFKRKDEVIGALLDRVLATTAMLHRSDDRAGDELGALLRHALGRLAAAPAGMTLFLEYWALGVREPRIRRRIAEALVRYRAAFRAVADDILGDHAAPRPGVDPDALAAVAVSLINGFAVQRMIDPDHLDTEAYLAAVDNLIAPLVTGRVAPAASPIT
jgi:AcrR family transcriptional regulator